jgi:hypothetical protein
MRPPGTIIAVTRTGRRITITGRIAITTTTGAERNGQSMAGRPPCFSLV